MQQPWLARVDLAAEVGDVRLDDVGLAVEVVVPDVIEDLGLGQHPLRVGHEVAEQLELRGREGDQLAGLPDLVGVVVEGEVGEGQPAVGGVDLGPGPAQHGSDPGDDLAQAEGLGDVVVCAGREAAHLVLGRVAGRQEQDGYAVALTSQPGQHREPVEPGHHHVEDHQVGPERRGQRQRLLAAGRGGDLEAGEAQAGSQQLDDVRLVVDDQQPCRPGVWHAATLGRLAEVRLGKP